MQHTLPALPFAIDAASRQRLIDGTDEMAWTFPVGTKFWKEFSVGGVRIETRLLEKRGPGSVFGEIGLMTGASRRACTVA